MFTGIVEEVGQVESVRPLGELIQLQIRARTVSEGVALGDSIAINGTCLTVTKIDGTHLCFDAIRETLECTALGDLVAGSRVNLECALRAGGRLDGHIVQGHVDGVGTVRALERRGNDVQLFVECPPELADLLVDKGSVAIDGVSLTVVKAEPHGFGVALIPHTLDATTLGEMEAGRRVNLEVDILGKYVKAYLDRTLGRDGTTAEPSVR